MQGALARTARGLGRLHHPRFLERFELGVDLAVADLPEVPGRAVGHLFDVVAGHRTEGDHAEQEKRSVGELHIAERYITKLYRTQGQCTSPAPPGRSGEALELRQVGAPQDCTPRPALTEHPHPPARASRAEPTSPASG